MKRVLVSLMVVAVAVVSLQAVDSKKAEYVGGTIAGLREKTEGVFLTTSDTVLTFAGKESPTVEIAYSSISELEYGQKAGRRVGVAIMVSPLALFSKKRNHFLTISYKDKAGKDQAGVFELGKDIVRTTLKIVEVRSGKEIKFQDVDACKQYKTPKECEPGK